MKYEVSWLERLAVIVEAESEEDAIAYVESGKDYGPVDMYQVNPDDELFVGLKALAQKEEGHPS